MPPIMKLLHFFINLFIYAFLTSTVLKLRPHNGQVWSLCLTQTSHGSNVNHAVEKADQRFTSIQHRCPLLLRKQYLKMALFRTRWCWKPCIIKPRIWKISVRRVKVGELQTSSHTLTFDTHPLTSFIFLSSKVNNLWHWLRQLAY